MNAFTTKALAALVLAGVMTAPAAANVQRDVQQSITSGNVNVTLDEAGVATLGGYTDSISRIAAKRAAEKNPDVDSVINLLERS